MKKNFILFMILFAALFAGCGTKRIVTHVIGAIATDGMVAVESDEDVPFTRATAPALIKTLEVLKQGNPKDYRMLTLLSMAYGQFAFGFLEEDMLKAKKDGPEFMTARNQADLFYRRGRDYGIAALISRGPMKKAFKSPVSDFSKAVSKLNKKYVPALFWTAFNWANYLNLHLDDPGAIADLPRIQAMINRVIELDSGYYCGSAHSFKGVIAASRPQMLGGSTETAKKEFDEAMGISPAYLMTKVLYAQYYSKQVQDPVLFENTLNEVINADANGLPAQRLSNELAKRRAKILILMKKVMF